MGWIRCLVRQDVLDGSSEVQICCCHFGTSSLNTSLDQPCAPWPSPLLPFTQGSPAAPQTIWALGVVNFLIFVSCFRFVPRISMKDI